MAPISKLRRIKGYLLGGYRGYFGIRLQALERKLGIKIPITRLFCNSYSHFFRDTIEFEDALINRYAEVNRELQVLCVGCGRGQEPYTIAIICDKHSIPVRITASDRSSSAIKIAIEGIYDLERDRSRAYDEKGDSPVDQINAHLDWFEPVVKESKSQRVHSLAG